VGTAGRHERRPPLA